MELALKYGQRKFKSHFKRNVKEDWLLQSFYVQATDVIIMIFFHFSIMVENIARKPRSKQESPQQWWLYCLEENRVLLVVCIFLCVLTGYLYNDLGEMSIQIICSF